jgi:hypothetical protein
MQHSSALEVEDERVVFGLMTGIEFIDGYGCDVIEPGLGKALSEVGFLDGFYHVPADIEMFGDMINRPKAQQGKSVALKAFGVGDAWFGKGNWKLSVEAAFPTDDSLRAHDDEQISLTGRRQTVGSFSDAVLYNVGAQAPRTVMVTVGVTHLEIYAVSDILCAYVFNPPHLVGVMQKRRTGHGGSSLL